jgi:elongator complex protein 2
MTKSPLLETDMESKAVGAVLPALGLTNKPVFGDAIQESTSHDYRTLTSYVNATSTSDSLTTLLTRPPIEGHLLQHTLWPEKDKLYGHGYEMNCLATNKDGSIIASSSKVFFYFGLMKGDEE